MDPGVVRREATSLVGSLPASCRLTATEGLAARRHSVRQADTKFPRHRRTRRHDHLVGLKLSRDPSLERAWHRRDIDTDEAPIACDVAAVEGGLSSDLIAFPPPTYGEMVFAAGFEFRLVDVPVPQADHYAEPGPGSRLRMNSGDKAPDRVSGHHCRLIEGFPVIRSTLYRHLVTGLWEQALLRETELPVIASQSRTHS